MERISRAVHVAPDVLETRYAEDLEVGGERASAEVVWGLYHGATSGNLIAAIYWTKALLGWSDQGKRTVEDERARPIREQIRELIAARRANPDLDAMWNAAEKEALGEDPASDK